MGRNLLSYENLKDMMGLIFLGCFLDFLGLKDVVNPRIYFVSWILDMCLEMGLLTALKPSKRLCAISSLSLERGEGKEEERERNIVVREKH